MPLIPSNQPQKRAHWRISAVLLGIAIVFAVITYAVRRAVIAADERRGRERYGEQISQQFAQLKQEQEQKQLLESRKALLHRLQDSLSRNQQDTSLLLPIGSLMIETGDTLGALTIYKFYIDSINNTNVVALTDYAFLLYATGQRHQGRSLNERALRLAPRYQIALYNMAVMDYEQGNITDALRRMKQCYVVDSTSMLGKLAQRAIEHLQQQTSPQLQ